MAITLTKTVTTTCSVRNAPSIHGAGIPGSLIQKGEKLQVLVNEPSDTIPSGDFSSPHDKWIKVVGPIPRPVKADGTWMNSNMVAWIEEAHLGDIVASDIETYLLKVDYANRITTLTKQV